MNLLDGSWISFDKSNIFHDVLDHSQVRDKGDGMNSLDRSSNGLLQPIFFSQTKTGQTLNESFRFLNRSGMNFNDDSRILNSSLRSSKQFTSGFQPFHQEIGQTQLAEVARMPAMCIATKMQQSQQQQSQKSEKSQQFVIANYKNNNDESLDAQIKNKKNETKNIPKNYGKAIITFMQKNKDKILQMFGIDNLEHDLIAQLKNRKKSINTIRDIRDLWIKSKYSKQFRIISNLFLRKYAFEYIFNSRITNYSSHIKYHHKLREAVISPESFICIKDREF